ALFPTQRRLLQAIAVTGGGTVNEVGALLNAPGDVVEALQALVDERLVRMEAGVLRITHPIVGDTVLAMAPAGALATLHEKAAAAAARSGAEVELRAFHAVLGQPDFQAFLLSEEAAKLRSARGDDEGAIAILTRGLDAARTQGMRGDLAAASAG